MGRSQYKLLSDISVSSIQALVNKLAGLLVFFIISRQLDKNSFGMLNWVLAVVTVLFTLSAFGTDQLIVKKTAVKEDPSLFLGIYFFHIFFSGLFFLLLIGLLLFLGNYPAIRVQMFWLLSLSQCLIYFSTAFKNIANGAERFGVLFVMSTCASISRALLLAGFLLFSSVSLQLVLWIYFISSLAEFLLSLLVYRLHLQLPLFLQFQWARYRLLLKEALPLLGTSVLNIALARFDWILLGLLTTTLVVADYSFAYRLFELSSLPAWIISPVLLPRISKMFSAGKEDNQEQQVQQIHLAVRWQIMFAVFTGGLLCLSMPGILSLLSGSKYGQSSYLSFLILAVAMPLMYLNNIFWSILFARGKTRTIFFCALITFLTNAVADLLLIPFFSANGAALGFVLATIAQSFYYLRYAALPGAGRIPGFILIVYAIAVATALIAAMLFNALLPELFLFSALYLLCLLLTKQFPRQEWQALKKILVT